MKKMSIASLIALVAVVGCGKSENDANQNRNQGEPQRREERPVTSELEGKWKAKCTPVGGGEYRSDVLSFQGTSYSQTHESFRDRDCTQPRLSRTMTGTFKIGDAVAATTLDLDNLGAPARNVTAKKLETKIVTPAADASTQYNLFLLENGKLYVGVSTENPARLPTRVVISIPFTKVP